MQAHVFLTFSNHCMKDRRHDEKTFEQEIIALRRSLGGRFAPCGAGRTKGRPVNKQAQLRDRLGASALAPPGRAPEGKQRTQASPDLFAAPR